MGSYGLIPVELWVFFSPHGPFWGPFWVILDDSEWLRVDKGGMIARVLLGEERPMTKKH